MSAETDFLNDALGQAGYGPIANIDDGSAAARWCKTFYRKLRRAALRVHNWNFAEWRAELAESATDPTFEFAYSFALPGDFIKLKEYNGSILNPAVADNWGWLYWPGRFKIEGSNIYTNEATVKIVYVRDIDNPELWDELFYQMLSTWLASKLAAAIGKDQAKADRLYQQAIGFGLPLAAAVDSQEETPIPYQSDALTRVRW